MRFAAAMMVLIISLPGGEMAFANPDPVPDPAAQADRQAKEIAAIKAALIYKFVKFVEWPEARFDRSSSPIVIGVVGKDPFGSILDKTFKGKRHGKRKFKLVRFPTPERIKDCHILFVPSAEAKNIKKVNERVRGKSVLMIGDWAGFANQGGIINFYLEKTKDKDGEEAVTNKFEINNDEAKRQKIKISSQLLKLARSVKDKKEKGESRQ